MKNHSFYYKHALKCILMPLIGVKYKVSRKYPKRRKKWKNHPIRQIALEGDTITGIVVPDQVKML